MCIPTIIAKLIHNDQTPNISTMSIYLMTDEWINKTWYTHTVKHSLKRDTAFVTT